MKKGVFTIANYFAPRRGILSMHCSATADRQTGRSSLLFGLSGTGKTTLSADPRRHLIGDDEHCWSDEGIFNIEGGCYAKAINLTAESEPDIFQALRFGAVLENVVLEEDRGVDYATPALQNTRGAYPIEFIHGAKIPCRPAIHRRLSRAMRSAFCHREFAVASARYHFISGYGQGRRHQMGITIRGHVFPVLQRALLIWHPSKICRTAGRKDFATQRARGW